MNKDIIENNTVTKNPIYLQNQGEISNVVPNVIQTQKITVFL